MDAQRAWDELLELWSNGELEEASMKAHALRRWLQKGQPEPPNVSETIPFESGAALHRSMAIAACGVLDLSAIMAASKESPRTAFVLSCASCNNEGPSSMQEANCAGWARIEHVPDSMSENFLGICPTCQVAD